MKTKACIGFAMEDEKEAWEHMQYEVITDYGDYAFGHYLHTWDDGNRILVRCKNCGGYIFIQRSEFHSYSDGPDGYYTDYFPVESPEEAVEWNRKCDGFEIEKQFPERYLCRTNGSLHWSE